MLFQTSRKHFLSVLIESYDLPVLVDFYAPWCAPCRALTPELEALTDEYEQQISGYSVNIDTETHLAECYQIKELPTVLLFRNAEIIARWEKEVSVTEIREKIKSGS